MRQRTMLTPEEHVQRSRKMTAQGRAYARALSRAKLEIGEEKWREIYQEELNRAYQEEGLSLD